ncbi:hypothetical protein HDU99_003366, partial [Rhizoclosmatium hyalinum]
SKQETHLAAILPTLLKKKSTIRKKKYPFATDSEVKVTSNVETALLAPEKTVLRTGSISIPSSASPTSVTATNPS